MSSLIEKFGLRENENNIRRGRKHRKLYSVLFNRDDLDGVLAVKQAVKDLIDFGMPVQLSLIMRRLLIQDPVLAYSNYSTVKNAVYKVVVDHEIPLENGRIADNLRILKNYPGVALDWSRRGEVSKQRPKSSKNVVREKPVSNQEPPPGYARQEASDEDI